MVYSFFTCLIVQKSTRASVVQGVEKAVAVTEEVLASPISAVKQSRKLSGLAKSVGATATSPSPPKTRTRGTPRKAH